MGNCMDKRRAIVNSEEKLEYSGGNVHIITDKGSWDEKISEANKDGKIVVANFHASWCAPCRFVAPVYSKLSKAFPSFTFLSIDADQMTEISTPWDIQATPTFIFLKDGQQLDKLVGANTIKLEEKLKNLADLH
ncbi:thioredoxin H4-1-like [Phoenix dactylifera]|uniref:Thioredoxin H4-1-like n=1 Tax=Phoenix dactylifera TaxID=42345 RepID=A0A8B9A577_PHODC|nr:thioredoxin H4-1-like [Phoenix dactylifera]